MWGIIHIGDRPNTPENLKKLILTTRKGTSKAKVISASNRAIAIRLLYAHHRKDDK